MSLQIVKPKTLVARDAFMFWVRQSRQDYPRLRFTYRNTRVVSKNKDYVSYLEDKLLGLDKEIQELEMEDQKNKYHFTGISYRIIDLKKQTFEARKQLEAIRKKNPSESMVIFDYYIFKKVIDLYCKKLTERLIEGQAINLRNRLGYIRIMKINRTNHRTKNWGESYKYRNELIAQGRTPRSKEHPEGEDWFQYMEGPYLRYAWIKSRGMSKVPNNTFYGFYPTKGKVGIKGKLAEAQKEDEFRHFSYRTMNP